MVDTSPLNPSFALSLLLAISSPLSSADPAWAAPRSAIVISAVPPAASVLRLVARMSSSPLGPNRSRKTKVCTHLLISWSSKPVRYRSPV